MRLRKPPKLVRPEVEVELRALARLGGVGEVVISSDGLPRELIVDDRSRKPNRRGGARVGDE